MPQIHDGTTLQIKYNIRLSTFLFT
uniref:Uncharacterized protein n=1 Tax=Arundo donax TaxID=35708 RepID=A0A0A9EXT7_ARUDO